MASIAQIREKYRKRGWVGPATASPSPSRVRRSVLENQLATLKRENDDLNRTMYEAAQVQRRLCGPRYFRTGDYELASEIFPVRHLSGDFIILMQLGGDLVFTIGDIAGKGVAAGDRWARERQGRFLAQPPRGIAVRPPRGKIGSDAAADGLVGTA